MQKTALASLNFERGVLWRCPSAASPSWHSTSPWYAPPVYRDCAASRCSAPIAFSCLPPRTRPKSCRHASGVVLADLYIQVVTSQTLQLDMEPQTGRRRARQQHPRKRTPCCAEALSAQGQKGPSREGRSFEVVYYRNIVILVPTPSGV